MVEGLTRVPLKGLLRGVIGCVPEKQNIQHLLSPLFECDGFDYYVHTLTSSEWNVFKCASDGQAIAEYYVRMSSKGILTCGCFSGRRHLLCRHKEMVTSLKTKPVAKNKDDVEKIKAEIERITRELEKLEK